MDLNLWKQRKKELKLTLLDISQRANIPKRTVDDIFAGVTKNPRTDTVQAIEQALGLTNQYSVIQGDVQSIGNGLVPLVGQVVAGIPVESSEFLESYVTVDYPHPENYFALRVNGDSMINARIFPNDVLIVKKQNYAENGDIVVASINNESTVKRYKIVGESIFLFPENSKYEPIPITSNSNLFIFGKVVEVRAKI